MIDEPVLDTLTARPAAVIHLLIPKDAIQTEMGPAYAELIAAVAAQGIGPAGPWYSVHHRMAPDVWDFEIGVPVTGPVATAGRVVAGEFPGGRVARTVYHGGYEGLAGGWEAFAAWITAAGHTPAAPFWEVYAAGPESSPDPAAWRTELYRPLA